MDDQTTLAGEVARASRDHGITAALTALIGGTMALIAAITRKAFTNEALLDRLDRELITDRDRIDRQRSEDRKADSDRLDRIETDIRSMRDMLLGALSAGSHTITPQSSPSTESGFTTSVAPGSCHSIACPRASWSTSSLVTCFARA